MKKPIAAAIMSFSTVYPPQINEVVNLPADHRFGRDYLDRFPINDPIPSPHDAYQWLEDSGHRQLIDMKRVRALMEFANDHLIRCHVHRLNLILDICDNFVPPPWAQHGND